MILILIPSTRGSSINSRQFIDMFEEIPDQSAQSTTLPESLLDYADLFDDTATQQLPPPRPFDCSIEVEYGSSPFVGKVYSMTQEEDLVL